jgi:hypothetical protein
MAIAFRQTWCLPTMLSPLRPPAALRWCASHVHTPLDRASPNDTLMRIHPAAMACHQGGHMLPGAQEGK